MAEDGIVKFCARVGARNISRVMTNYRLTKGSKQVFIKVDFCSTKYCTNKSTLEGLCVYTFIGFTASSTTTPPISNPD